MILDHTLNKWKELWNQCNECVHNHHDKSQLSEKTKRIHAELEHIYRRRKLYLCKDQDILFDNVDQHKELPVSSIQNWLLLYKNYFQESSSLAKKYALRGVSKITNFFKIK